jgi:hypothetical protein
MHALILESRREMLQNHLTLQEEAEEEDEEMNEMELNSKEHAVIMSIKATKRAVVGRKKKMQA